MRSKSPTVSAVGPVKYTRSKICCKLLERMTKEDGKNYLLSHEVVRIRLKKEDFTYGGISLAHCISYR